MKKKITIELDVVEEMLLLEALEEKAVTGSHRFRSPTSSHQPQARVLRDRVEAALLVARREPANV